jgi:hypothetical protein
MMVLSSIGPNVWTSMLAMDAFIICLDWISPARRWEKNSIGRRRTFHMYDELPITAILPLILSEYIAWAHSTMSCSTANATRASMNG